MVFANLLKNTAWWGSFVLVGVTMMMSLLGFNFGSVFFFSVSGIAGFMDMVIGGGAMKLSLTLFVRSDISLGCGANCVLFETATLVEKREDLPVGAKPVKKPITKHKEKWSMAFFHRRTFFFDLSSEPILIKPCVIDHLKQNLQDGIELPDGGHRMKRRVVE
ncbi:hypothetical protein V8G54_022423 [Vigna mungo]|uniref:Uncharacterized protein n=1 Tax=Vigna mungo TaxID=3915 RepID=A0AAQ3RWQ3_VIGMU